MNRLNDNTIGRWVRGRGFTLVELLVVIAVIALLVSIGSYGFLRARSGARKAMTDAMIASISAGMDQYKADTLSYPSSDWAKQEYPTSNSPIWTERWFGSQILTQVMLGYLDAGDSSARGDLKDGLGFRNRARGKVFGPYINANAKTRDIATDSGDERPVLLDGFDNPVLFYSYDVLNQEYVVGHNKKSGVDAPADFDHDGPDDLDAYVKSAGRHDYLIMTPGEDLIYGETPSSTDTHGMDDRNNFAQE